MTLTQIIVNTNMYIKLYLLLLIAIYCKNITAWSELVKVLEFGQFQWYCLVQFLYLGDRNVLSKCSLSHCVPCAALAPGGSGDCCFHAHRTGSCPRSHRDEKAPPSSPHVCWAALT